MSSGFAPSDLELLRTEEEIDIETSEGLRRKYARHASMPPMVRSYLETTLELVPR